jgi:hypothetical protein
MSDSWILTEMPCMAHTPGPWITAGPHGTGIAPASMPNERLAVAMAMDCELTEEDMYGDDVPLESQVANARLIAAAPELLHALRGVAERWDKDDEADDPVLGAVIRSAIAKAEGRE